MMRCMDLPISLLIGLPVDLPTALPFSLLINLSLGLPNGLAFKLALEFALGFRLGKALGDGSAHFLCAWWMGWELCKFGVSECDVYLFFVRLVYWGHCALRAFSALRLRLFCKKFAQRLALSQIFYIMSTVPNNHNSGMFWCGEVSEWLKEHAWKACIR